MASQGRREAPLSTGSAAHLCECEHSLRDAADGAVARAQVGVAHEGEQRGQRELDDPRGVSPRQGSEAAGGQLPHVAVPVAQLRGRRDACTAATTAPTCHLPPPSHLDVQEGVEKGVAVLREAGDDGRDDRVSVRAVAEREIVSGLQWVGAVLAARRGRGGYTGRHAR